MTDPVLFLQISVANAYHKVRGLSVAEFNELDRKYKVLRYLEIGYEPFHLTGTQGVIDEIDDYLKAQRERGQRDAKIVSGGRVW